MKIEYFESQYGLQIDMKPETPAEMAQLLRLTNNAKARELVFAGRSQAQSME